MDPTDNQDGTSIPEITTGTIEPDAVQPVVLSVSGSRTFVDYNTFVFYMRRWCSANGTPETIVHGGAQGADLMANRYAKENGIKLIVLTPEWNKYGRRAGIIRNELIVKSGTHLLAFCVNKSGGTMNAVSRAERAGKPVVLVCNPMTDARIVTYNGGSM